VQLLLDGDETVLDAQTITVRRHNVDWKLLFIYLTQKQ